MTQYAYFDATAPAPAPVIGWYDTVAFTYPNLPSTANLLALTAPQWAARLTGQWAISGGTLVAYTPPAVPVSLSLAKQAAVPVSLSLAKQAAVMLTVTDTTMHRVSEAVVLGLNTWTGSDVVAWMNYRRVLRAIANGTNTTSTTLPTKPAYPVGT
jgi:hypothetical protein